MLITTTIQGFSLYQIIWLFFIYALFGWLLEVVYCTSLEGVFVNRGFLNGPVCPIYGFGGVSVILFLANFGGNIAMIFLAGMFITSAIELVGGFVLEKLFHTRWWDYSDQPFNIGGYVCLRFSLAWGVACILLMELLQPLVMGFIDLVPVEFGNIYLIISGLYISTDVVVTTLTVNSLNKDLTRLHELQELLRRPSDKMAEDIFEDYQKWQTEKEKLTEKRSALQARLVIAFPKMRSIGHESVLDELKERLKARRKKALPQSEAPENTNSDENE